MGAQRLTSGRRRQLTREALLGAAESVFAQRGYEAGTLEEIAESAGFTTGAIYSNFGSKQELFLAVLERRNEKLTEAYREVLEPPTGQSVALSDVADLWTHLELANRDALRLTLEYRLAALRDPAIQAPLAEFERRTEEAIARFIRDHLSHADVEDLDVRVEDFAVVVHAASQGILQHVAVCSTDHAKLFETFLSLLTRGLSRMPAQGSRTAR
jgi:AcrR family transcriptional regulator